MLFGCQSVVPIDEVVYEDQQGWVGIRPFPSFVRFICHPKLMTESEFGVILSGLHIQEFPSLTLSKIDPVSTHPVFTEKQIAWLAPKLAQSLVRTIEENYVLFRIYEQETGPRQETEGIFYASQQGYHVTLTHYRVPVNPAAENKKSFTQTKNWRLFFSPQRALWQEQDFGLFFAYEPDSNLGMIHLQPMIIFRLSLQHLS